MTRRTQLTSLLALGGALLWSGVAHSQYGGGYPGGGGGGGGDPGGGAPAGGGYPGGGGGGYPGGGGGGPAAGGGASDLSTVTNTSTETVTTDTAMVEEGTMPNTGGEPLLMSLIGSLTACGALALRRKLS